MTFTAFVTVRGWFISVSVDPDHFSLRIERIQPLVETVVTEIPEVTALPPARAGSGPEPDLF